MSISFYGYTSEGDGWSSAGAGTSQWLVARKDGKRYFIKSFLAPTKLDPSSTLPDVFKKAKEAAWNQFVESKQKLYDKLRIINMGNLVVPSSLLVYEGHLCSVQDFVDQNLPPEEVCRLPERRRLEIMRAMIYNMKALAENGIINGDIKLDNMMLTMDGRGACMLKLIDFDNGYFVQNQPKKAQDVHGDQLYMSPEVWRRANDEELILDPRLDIFSLGVALHLLWCGEMPAFDKERFHYIGLAVQHGAPVTLSRTLPEKTRAVIGKMLANNRDERPGFGEIYEALGQDMKALPPLMIRDMLPYIRQYLPSDTYYQALRLAKQEEREQQLPVMPAPVPLPKQEPLPGGTGARFMAMRSGVYICPRCKNQTVYLNAGQVIPVYCKECNTRQQFQFDLARTAEHNRTATMEDRKPAPAPAETHVWEKPPAVKLEPLEKPVPETPKSKKWVRVLAFLLVVGALLAAAWGMGLFSGAGERLLEGTWKQTGRIVDGKAEREDKPATLRFSDGKVVGLNGEQAYSYSAASGVLTIKAGNQNEQLTYSLDNGELKLYSPTGSVILVFRKQ